MYIKALEAVVNDGTLSSDVAEKYLTLYLGTANWKEKLSQMWSVQKKKLNDETKAKDFVKKSIACACLSPVVNKSVIPEENHVLLFWVSGWPQFNERDWFDLFKKVIKEDIQIESNRKKVLQAGVFDQLDMSPLTRQAYNWLYEKLDRENFATIDDKKR